MVKENIKELLKEGYEISKCKNISIYKNVDEKYYVTLRSIVNKKKIKEEYIFIDIDKAIDEFFELIKEYFND